ncbi:MAG: hypothetical protein KUG77_10340 [Nannocystaceae bacterium]|nr:hypothetical protein [Nannocystaceae bacterium]
MHDLLLISDLHLGSHLKPRLRGEEVHLASRIEEEFPRFIDHHLQLAEARQVGWQMVVNGDFIDFWNVVLDEREDEDSEALAVRRLHAVLDAHPAVEDSLARFLEAGHGVAFVTGNHDAELLYGGVRQAMVERIEGAMSSDDADASITRTGTVRLDMMRAGKIRFVRWFLREPGGAWIEHGHKFDPSCATPAALSPTRGGALVQTVAEVATRSFANVMPEIDYDAPDKFSGFDYARWALARGWRFVLRVILLYLRMVGRILGLWVGGRVDAEGQAVHDEQLGRIAANAGLQMSALAALENMAPPPAAVTVGGLVKLTALDHVLMMLTPVVLAVVFATLRWVPLWAGLPLAVAIGAAGIAFQRRGRQRRDVARDMLNVAAGVGQATGVPLVLMGHSHHGELERRGDVVYANSGSWLDGSHLYVEREPETQRLIRVELRQWRNGGVRCLDAMSVPQPDAPVDAAVAERAEAALESATDGDASGAFVRM